MLFRSLVLRIAALGFVKGLVTRSSLFKPLVFRFVAGESLDQAIKAAEDLASKGLCSTLDLLGENVASAEEAKASAEAYIKIVNRIAASPHRDRINISIKLTALGLDQGFDVARANCILVLEAAAAHGIFVRVDMEGSEYTDRTLDLVESVFPGHSNTGTVLQAMMRRTDKDLERLLELGCRVRLVKGAYLEPPDRAFPDKAEVDAQYVQQAKALLARGSFPAIATHDTDIITQVKAFIEKEGIPRERYEWQMLYGIRRDLQEELIREGHNVRVYIPYGSEWYPYFTRRLAERPANVGFILKALTKK